MQRFARHAAVLLLPAVWFLSAPLEVIRRNLDEIPLSAATIGAFATAFVLSAIVSGILWRLGEGRRGGWKTVCAVLVFAAIVPLLAAGSQAALGGLRLRYLLPLEAAAFGAVFVGLLRIPFPTLRTVAGAVTLAVVASELAVVPAFVGHVRRQRQATATRASSPARPPSAAGGNVYHIVLDGFQREAYDAVLRQRPSLALEGFSDFRGFHTEYSRTHHSLAALFQGTVYREGVAWKPWLEDYWENGFLRELDAAGVSIHLYPHSVRHSSSHAATTRPLTSLPLAIEESGLQLYSTVDVWFRAVVPVAVIRLLDTHVGGSVFAPQQGTYGFQLTHHVGSWLPDPADVRPEHTAVLSREHFKIMLADIPSRGRHGEYTFLHALLPHGPNVLDRDGRYPVRHANELAGYLEMSEYALRLVHDLVDVLKQHGTYDESLIIVHTDHGLYWPPELFERVSDARREDAGMFRQIAAMPGGEGAREEARRVSIMSSGLLLVKFPRARGGVSDVPVGLVDIAPTVLRHFGVQEDGWSGAALQDVSESSDRRGVHYYHRYQSPEEDYSPSSFVEYEWRRELGWSRRGLVRVARDAPR